MVFMFNVCVEGSLGYLINYIEEFNNINCHKILIADLINCKDNFENRKVTTEMGAKIANKYNFNYYETSAMDASNNIELIFKNEINYYLNNKEIFNTKETDYLYQKQHKHQ